MLEPYLESIISLATTYNLPVNLVKAICMVESSGIATKFRYEPGYRWLLGNVTLMNPTEQVGQKCSWGLMQVMGAVARELGFHGDFPELCATPALGIDYGCRHLKRYYVQYNGWPDTVASYNAGHPTKIGERYANQSYVDQVYRWWNHLDQVGQV